MQYTCYLYLDETGSFNQGVRSAIGGFYAWTPVTDRDISTFWNDVLGHPLGNDKIHCCDHPESTVSKWTCRAAERMSVLDWTPFIFEHVTRQWIVNNPTTYVHVLADGVTKLARMLSIMKRQPIDLHILAARRSLPEESDPSRPVPMPPDLYASRLKERLDFERLRSL